MGLEEKVTTALRSLQPDYIRIEDDDGISGYVVSPIFKKMSPMDRQTKIDDALEVAPLDRSERRRILMIAGITPEEYSAVGAKIRVHRIAERGGTVRVVLRGGLPDAQYVRGILNNVKGVKTTSPRPVDRAVGVLMEFGAKGSSANPLSKERVVSLLKSDQYVEVMDNA